MITELNSFEGWVMWYIWVYILAGVAIWLDNIEERRNENGT